MSAGIHHADVVLGHPTALTVGDEVYGYPPVWPRAFDPDPAALEGGDVQAYIGTEPLCTQSVASGVGTRIPGTYDTPLGDLNTALWVSSKALQDPERVRVALAGASAPELPFGLDERGCVPE